MKIERYVIVDADDNEGEHEYETLYGACKAAEAEDELHGVYEHEYEYTGRTVAWSPVSGHLWPPGSDMVVCGTCEATVADKSHHKGYPCYTGDVWSPEELAKAMEAGDVESEA